MSPSVLPEAAVPVPSSQRCERGSVNIPIAKWPKAAVDGPVDADAIAKQIVSSINSNLSKLPSKEAAEGVASLFLNDESYWRDHLALSWDLKTVKGQEEIASFLQDNSSLTHVSLDTSTEWRSPKFKPFNAEKTSNGILFYIAITTKLGSGHGVVRLVEDGSEGWKIWTFFTTLDQLRGFEEPIGPRRASGAQHGYHSCRKNWTDRRNEELDFVDHEPDVLIIGLFSPNLSHRRDTIY